eukprot:758615-Hanusia_phi.AAC.4
MSRPERHLPVRHGRVREGGDRGRMKHLLLFQRRGLLDFLHDAMLIWAGLARESHALTCWLDDEQICTIRTKHDDLELFDQHLLASHLTTTQPCNF